MVGRHIVKISTAEMFTNMPLEYKRSLTFQLLAHGRITICVFYKMDLPGFLQINSPMEFGI